MPLLKDKKLASGYGNIVLTGPLKSALLAQAKHERLLGPGKYESEIPLRRNAINIQKALALLVLHDTIYLPDYFLPDAPEVGYAPLVPTLEDEGVLKRLVDFYPIGRGFVVSGTNWHERRDPAVFARELVRVKTYLPFVLRRLRRRPHQFVTTIATGTSKSITWVQRAIIEYADSFYRDDRDGLATNLFAHMGDFTEELNRSLREQRPRDGLNAFDSVLFKAIYYAEQVDELRIMSERAEAPVAGADISATLVSAGGAQHIVRGLDRRLKTFAIIRTALTEEGIYFPRIEGIEHALTLRKNSHIAALRRKLLEFEGALRTAGISDIVSARREVQRAIKHMRRATSWANRMRWITFSCLPLGFVESLLIEAPVVSTGVSLVSIAVQELLHSWNEGSRWVLIGR